MRTFLLAVFTFSVLASPAVAGIIDVFAPDTANSGDPYVPAIWYEVPNSCWGFEGVDFHFEEPFIIWEITSRRYDYPMDYPCHGPIELYIWEPEIVFPTPGMWTLRVIEHILPYWIVPGEDIIWECPVQVADAVAVEPSSWGAIKATYR